MSESATAGVPKASLGRRLDLNWVRVVDCVSPRYCVSKDRPLSMLRISCSEGLRMAK